MPLDVTDYLAKMALALNALSQRVDARFALGEIEKSLLALSEPVARLTQRASEEPTRWQPLLSRVVVIYIVSPRYSSTDDFHY